MDTACQPFADVLVREAADVMGSIHHRPKEDDVVVGDGVLCQNSILSSSTIPESRTVRVRRDGSLRDEVVVGSERHKSPRIRSNPPSLAYLWPLSIHGPPL